jgi:hypothetical protein
MKTDDDELEHDSTPPEALEVLEDLDDGRPVPGVFSWRVEL